MLDKVRSILETTDVDVNSLNSDGLSGLDIAVLMNNRQMTKILLQHGALHGPQSSSDNLGNYLSSLMFDAEQKLHHLGGISESAAAQAFNTRASFSSIIGSTSQSCTGSETERQMGVWEKRIRGLKTMIAGNLSSLSRERFSASVLSTHSLTQDGKPSKFPTLQ